MKRNTSSQRSTCSIKVDTCWLVAIIRRSYAIPVKVVTVVGARPQFIKAAPVSKILRETGCAEILVHTGQHYDANMSDVFFSDMAIPLPDVSLGVGSGSHGYQTARMLEGVEKVLLEQEPDWLLSYGDTNSTLAASLAACKLQIPIAHVEAGLRSYRRDMPEEHNRVLTDHCSEVLFCPTATAVKNLEQEGITRGIHLVGDTMYDAVLQFSAIARERSTILSDLALTPKHFLLATIHRPYNTDVSENLESIVEALIDVGEPVVFPIHPRTRPKIDELGTQVLRRLSRSAVRIVQPVGYLDMLALEQCARLILTDSGGVQKEAYFFEVPCITLRPETEWIETVNTGWNVLVAADRRRIAELAADGSWPAGPAPRLFGDGTAAHKIALVLAQDAAR